MRWILYRVRVHVCQWFNVLNCECSTRSAMRFGVWRNKWLLGGLALANALHIAVIYWPPLGRLFHAVPIPLADFFLIGAVASIVLWAGEARKLLERRRACRNRNENLPLGTPDWRISGCKCLQAPRRGVIQQAQPTAACNPSRICAQRRYAAKCRLANIPAPDSQA